MKKIKGELGEYFCWFEPWGWSGSKPIVAVQDYALWIFPFKRTVWRGTTRGLYDVEVMHPNEITHHLEQAVFEYESYLYTWT